MKKKRPMLLASPSIGFRVNNDRPPDGGGPRRPKEAKDYQPHSCCRPAILRRSLISEYLHRIAGRIRWVFEYEYVVFFPRHQFGFSVLSFFDSSFLVHFIPLPLRQLNLVDRQHVSPNWHYFLCTFHRNVAGVFLRLMKCGVVQSKKFDATYAAYHYSSRTLMVAIAHIFGKFSLVKRPLGCIALTIFEHCQKESCQSLISSGGRSQCG